VCVCSERERERETVVSLKYIRFLCELSSHHGVVCNGTVLSEIVSFSTVVNPGLQIRFSTGCIYIVSIQRSIF